MKGAMHGISGPHHGRCACGGVRFIIAGPLSDVVACHCRTCRRISGNYWAATHANRADLQIADDGALAWYASSTTAERGFCRHCGSTLFFRKHASARVSISPGALNEPAGLATTAHICCDEAGDYYPLPPDAACYPGPDIID